ncbi:LexA family transcriptional regulator [Sphingobacterium sp. SRCM116780]|uniref:XRE family transcriptional regulator n=1 Tax=Sphingobacterium sp. SRCM116780 TaxID=2907623 RepID=UPI001F17E32E|nr:LexA family transcriptional regulator [Sphingobacterium sp. SRCM116780]UIR57831.1 LexA family transcriptional regulator [Sphingobacterium sp. SRCM116780]
MLLLAENLRFLRNEIKASQQSVADTLLITRGRYAKYEDGANDPPIEILLKLSRFYRISVDLLISVDLRKYRLDEILKLPDNRILLPIKTDTKGENKIEVIPYKASMGYLAGYSDPEYIENLQTMSLPFLHNGKYRAFPVEGDSMPPYKDGTYIIGRYIESLQELKINKTYLLITRTGFIFKRIESINETSITVKSDNTFYENYNIPFVDLYEAWQYAGSFSSQELEVVDLTDEDVKSMLFKLMQEVKEIKGKVIQK